MKSYSMLASAALLSLSLPALAGINGIGVDPDPARAGQAVKLTVTADGDGTNFCGMRVEYGDGSGEDVKIANEHGLFPRTLSHTYAKAGAYAVSAKGKKVTTHLPCPGQASATVKVVADAPAAAARGGAKPVCPDGWKTTASKADGTLTCALQRRDAAKIECPAGLEAWEKGTNAGCRKPK